MPAFPGSDVRKLAMRSAANVSKQMRRHAMIGTSVKLPVGLKRYLVKAARRAT